MKRDIFFFNCYSVDVIQNENKGRKNIGTDYIMNQSNGYKRESI